MDPTQLTKQELLKVFTTIPNAFIDDFYVVLYQKPNNEFPISLDTAAKWLECNRNELKRTLTNSYEQDFDYIIHKAQRASKINGGQNKLDVFMTVDCFKRICMRTRSPKGETVRTYFIELDNFISTYAAEFSQAIKDKIMDATGKIENSTRKTEGPGWLYAFQTAEDPDFVKIGETKRELQERLDEYNTGRKHDVVPIVQLYVPRRKDVEACLKTLLEEKQYKHHREVYEADMDIIKKLIKGCNRLSMTIHMRNKARPMKGSKYYLVFVSEDEIAAKNE